MADFGISESVFEIEIDGELVKTRQIRTWIGNSFFARTVGRFLVERKERKFLEPGRKGYFAFKKGLSINENPYEPNSIDWFDWKREWQKAQ